jgi:hypothetical protein
MRKKICLSISLVEKTLPHLSLKKTPSFPFGKGNFPSPHWGKNPSFPPLKKGD